MSVHELYGRAVTVLIGPDKSTGKLIQNLRVTFKVDKNLEKHPNPATIQIYNLSEDSRAIIEQKNSKILLSAGYGNPATDVMPVLFRGTVSKVETKRSGSDIITDIEAADGGYAYGNSTINLSFAPGATVQQVLSNIQSAMGLGVGSTNGLNGALQFPHGLSISGMCKDALNTILGKQGMNWSIQDETLQIIPPDGSTANDAVILNSGWSEQNQFNTGLIGSPFKTKVLDPLFAKPVDGKVAQNGIKLVSLINPEIRPGRKIVVDSQFVDGTFTVYRVVFNGDTHGQAWYAEIEAR